MINGRGYERKVNKVADREEQREGEKFFHNLK